MLIRSSAALGEHLPFPSTSFDLVLSNEVIEHVSDDLQAVKEMVRTLKPGGRLVLFCPNRGYPYETHGIYRKGVYEFGNKLFVNYLPRRWRNKLAPHVRVYSRRDLRFFDGLPVRFIRRTVIFGAYDNIIARNACWVISCVVFSSSWKKPRCVCLASPTSGLSKKCKHHPTKISLYQKPRHQPISGRVNPPSSLVTHHS